MLNKILKQIAVFIAIFLVMNLAFSLFKKEEKVIDNNVTITTTKDEYSQRKTVTLDVYNGTGQTISFKDTCPAQPLRVYKKENNKWIEISATQNIQCPEKKDILIESGESLSIPYNNWQYSLFKDLGRFRIDMETKIGEEDVTIASNEFVVTKNGFFWQSVITVFYKPIYNSFIYIISVVPGHDLGLAIILLTFIIRSILLIPSQKAMKAQQKMQEIQPKLDAIKEKYKGDQQRISIETMALWKEAKVNPAGSCLPMLMQLPFLIALFYSVRNVSNPDMSFYLYSSLSDFNLSEVNTLFLNILDLTTPEAYFLPLIIGGLQFIQMKLSMAKNGKKETKNEFAKAQNMTMYFMPIMIAVFTASMPAGIGIYWGTSTLYGIIQQLFVNRSSKKTQSSVKVISN